MVRLMSIRDILEMKKRYAYLVTENLGNFQRIQEVGIVVLTHSVSCYHHILVFRFS